MLKLGNNSDLAKRIPKEEIATERGKDDWKWNRWYPFTLAQARVAEGRRDARNGSSLAHYLKQPHRIEALMIVMVMALLLYGVLEWRVREALKGTTAPLILPGKRKSFTPTGETLLALLQPIQVMVCQLPGGQLTRVLSSRMDENMKRVVELAGFDMTIYTSAVRVAQKSR